MPTHGRSSDPSNTVAFTRGTSTFINGPHDETLSATAIARGEDAGYTGGKPAVLGLEVGAFIAIKPDRVRGNVFGSEETHRQQHEL